MILKGIGHSKMLSLVFLTVFPHPLYFPPFSW